MGFFCCIKDLFTGEKMMINIFLAVMTLGIILASIKKYFRGGVNEHVGYLDGQIVVITGANTGLGFEAAKHFASLRSQPKKIILACRSQSRAQAAIDAIKCEIKCKDILEFMPLDLSDLQSVKSFAQDFKYDKIDILLNNAGIMALPKREETVQGFERQFGVNHIGHFVLTNLLLSKIKAAN